MRTATSVMINAQMMWSFATISRNSLRLVAKSTHATLLRKQLLKLLRRNPVLATLKCLVDFS